MQLLVKLEFVIDNLSLIHQAFLIEWSETFLDDKWVRSERNRIAYLLERVERFDYATLVKEPWVATECWWNSSK